MNKWMVFGVPLGLLALILVVAMVRDSSTQAPEVRERRRSANRPIETNPTKPPPPNRVVTPRRRPRATKPPPPPGDPADERVALSRSTLRTQLRIYVSSALRGDDNTRIALHRSLAKRAADTKALAQERISQSKSQKEIEILKHLVRSLE